MSTSNHLNGWLTAQNYIDECVIQENSEPDILFHILSKFKNDDEGLKGFADYLHDWMKK